MPYDIQSFQEGFQWGLLFSLGAGLVGFGLFHTISLFKRITGG